MNKLCVFASGQGSNAAQLMAHFKNHPQITVALLICNNKQAGAIQIANKHGVPVEIISKEQLASPEYLLPILAAHQISHLVLAGFLLLLPPYLISQFHNKIFNVHPSLLPKFGGSGMYGKRVHAAVLAAHELATGITIHLVNEKYDEGKIIFQAQCPVLPIDTVTSLAAKVQQLEHEWYSKIIEKEILAG